MDLANAPLTLPPDCNVLCASNTHTYTNTRILTHTHTQTHAYKI